MADITIEIADSVTAELVEAFARLIPQLSTSNAPPTAEQLTLIVESTATTVFIGRLDGRIVGSLTLVAFRIPTAVRTMVEDVVVDSAARGGGVANALTQAAIVEARRLGAKTIDLTSRPSREAANRLYQRIGFVQRDTNVYRYTLAD
jgi:ribosomal protein S18 acetylase RimI-like enzyme